MRRTHTQHRYSAAGLPEATQAYRCAFTLLEVLLATLLGGSVVTVTTVVAVQSVSVQRLVESKVMQRWEHVRVQNQFEADVEGELVWLPGSIETIVMPDEPTQLMEILTLVSVSDAETLFLRRLPARVAYVLQDSDVDTGSKRLWREVRFLTDPSVKVQREVVADGLVDARVERYDQDNWMTTPVPRDGLARRPRALRLTCHWSSDPEQPQTRTVMTCDRAQKPQSGGI